MAKKLEFYEGEEAQKRFEAGMKAFVSYKPTKKLEPRKKPKASPSR